MPHEDDFTPDVERLQQALRLLINARSRPGQPHVDPTLPLDLPQQWPAAGLGGDAALNLLARAALEQVSRLDHPGFLAHTGRRMTVRCRREGRPSSARSAPSAAPVLRSLSLGTRHSEVFSLDSAVE